MRIRLSDGTVIGTSAPSKRRCGSTSIGRAWREAQARAVGGVSNSVRAVYRNGDLCVVVTRKLNVTNDIGGSSPCGYVPGRGAV